MNSATPFSQITGKSWQAVKGEMIGRFGSVRWVAAQVGCHPNSLRVAVEGRCPGVQRRLEALLAGGGAQQTPGLQPGGGGVGCAAI